MSYTPQFTGKVNAKLAKPLTAQVKRLGKHNFAAWTRIKLKGDVPIPRTSAASVMCGSIMFLFGGINQKIRYNDTWLFDTSSSLWLKIRPQTDLPLERSSCTASLHGADILVFGGDNGETCMNDLWSFDLEEETWTPVTAFARDSDSPPIPRCRHAAAGFGNKMIIFGGQSRPFMPTYLNDMHIFDANTLKWTTIEYRAPEDPEEGTDNTNQKKKEKEKKEILIPCGRAGHTITLINSHLYLFGGFGEDGHHHSDLWVFSPITLSWQEIKTKSDERPGARSGHSAFSLGNNLFIYGGYCLGSTKTDVWMFDTTIFRWKRLDQDDNLTLDPPFYSPATRCNQVAHPIVSSSVFFQGLKSHSEPSEEDDEDEEDERKSYRTAGQAPRTRNKQVYSMFLYGGVGYESTIPRSDLWVFTWTGRQENILQDDEERRKEEERRAEEARRRKEGKRGKGGGGEEEEEIADEYIRGRGLAPSQTAHTIDQAHLAEGIKGQDEETDFVNKEVERIATIFHNAFDTAPAVLEKQEELYKKSCEARDKGVAIARDADSVVDATRMGMNVKRDYELQRWAQEEAINMEYNRKLNELDATEEKEEADLKTWQEDRKQLMKDREEELLGENSRLSNLTKEAQKDGEEDEKVIITDLRAQYDDEKDKETIEKEEEEEDDNLFLKEMKDIEDDCAEIIEKEIPEWLAQLKEDNTEKRRKDVETEFHEFGVLVKHFRERINEVAEREQLMRDEAKRYIKNIEEQIDSMSSDTRRNDKEYLQIVDKLFSRSILEDVLTEEKDVKFYEEEKAKHDTEWQKVEKEKQQIQSEQQVKESEALLLTQRSASNLFGDTEGSPQRLSSSPSRTSPTCSLTQGGATSSWTDLAEFEATRDINSPVNRVKTSLQRMASGVRRRKKGCFHTRLISYPMAKWLEDTEADVKYMDDNIILDVKTKTEAIEASLIARETALKNAKERVEKAEKDLVVMNERMKDANEEITLLRKYLEGNVNVDWLVQFWKNREEMHKLKVEHFKEVGAVDDLEVTVTEEEVDVNLDEIEHDDDDAADIDYDQTDQQIRDRRYRFRVEDEEERELLFLKGIPDDPVAALRSLTITSAATPEPIAQSSSASEIPLVTDFDDDELIDPARLEKGDRANVVQPTPGISTAPPPYPLLHFPLRTPFLSAVDRFKQNSDAERKIYPEVARRVRHLRDTDIEKATAQVPTTKTKDGEMIGSIISTPAALSSSTSKDLTVDPNICRYRVSNQSLVEDLISRANVIISLLQAKSDEEVRNALVLTEEEIARLLKDEGQNLSDLMESKVRRAEELIVEDRGREGELLEETSQMIKDVSQLRDQLSLTGEDMKRTLQEENEQLEEIVESVQRMTEAEKTEAIDIPVISPGVAYDEDRESEKDERKARLEAIEDENKGTVPGQLYSAECKAKEILEKQLERLENIPELAPRVIRRIIDEKMQKMQAEIMKKYEKERNDIKKILSDARKKEDDQEAKAIERLDRIKSNAEKRVRTIEVILNRHAQNLAHSMKQRWIAHEALLSEIETRLKYAEEEGKQRKLESDNIQQEQKEIVEEVKDVVLKELNLQLSVLERELQ